MGHRGWCVGRLPHSGHLLDRPETEGVFLYKLIRIIFYVVKIVIIITIIHILATVYKREKVLFLKITGLSSFSVIWVPPYNTELPLILSVAFFMG